jgi:hypothetical protein
MKFPAWNLEKAYRDLWAVWEEHIKDTEIDAEVVATLVAGLRPYDMVFSSIPVPAICHHSEHRFKSQKTYILIGPMEFEYPHMTYNGDPEIGDGWHRRSYLNGKTTSWEYSPDNWQNPPLQTTRLQRDGARR